MSIHNPRLRKLNQRGVTFIELLIVMGLLSILLVIMLTIFTSSIDDQAQSEGYAATISDGRFLLARLNYDIARATAVTNPATLGSTSSSLGLTINGATYTYALTADRWIRYCKSPESRYECVRCFIPRDW
jgi:prepilin-type N-terminal cleavage/methylation domain-containing protein